MAPFLSEGHWEYSRWNGNNNMCPRKQKLLLSVRSHDRLPEASGFSLAFNTLSDLLCWFLMDPRKGENKAAINFSCVRPSDLVLYSSGVLHLSISPRETGIKNGERNPRSSLLKYPKQNTLFKQGSL